MSFLTDADWEELKDELKVVPFSEDFLTPVGYDIGIGSSISLSSNPERKELLHEEKFIVEPGDTVFISSLERIEMPGDKSLSGMVVSKVSISATGLVHDTTTIDADWKGNLLIVMHNLSQKPIELMQGQRICTIVFFKNQTNSKKPSFKEDNRNDVLLKTFNANTKSYKKKKTRKTAFAFIVPIICFVAGFIYFGNAPGIIASVAIGSVIGQNIKEYT